MKFWDSELNENDAAGLQLFFAMRALGSVLGINYGDVRIRFENGEPTGLVEVRMTYHLDMGRMRELADKVMSEMNNTVQEAE